MSGRVLKTTIESKCKTDITKLSPNIQHVNGHFWKLTLAGLFTFETLNEWDERKDLKQLCTSTGEVYLRLLESSFLSGT